MAYRVHRLDLRMTRDQVRLEQFLNSLDGEVVAIIPNIQWFVLWVPRVDFVLVVERLVTEPSPSCRLDRHVAASRVAGR